MATVDPGNQLGAAMRLQLAALRERAATRTERSSRAGAPAPAGHTLSTAMAQRVQAIPPDDPDRPRKAVRVYLEYALAREFGARLVNDPAFPGLLDAVQQSMQEDAQLAAAAETLGRLLLAGKAGG